jgi:AcrR family transcriptional regulator
MKTPRSKTKQSVNPEDVEVRRRILSAALSAFMEAGYAQTSTLEIATRAHVSKRALYALFGSKQAMLAACISERAQRLKAPADLPALRDRETLAGVLGAFGTRLLGETSDPAVVAVFRLAIAEAVRAPEVAQTLHAVAYETGRAALREIMTNARSSGLLAGDPTEMTERFAGLLWGDLMIRLLLQVADRPAAREIERQARDAAAAFLQLYPEPQASSLR